MHGSTHGVAGDSAEETLSVQPLLRGTATNSLASWPAMNLRLQFPPTPENAAAHAQLAVDAARNVDHVQLDYSPQSLVEVDRILGKFHTEGLRADQIGETVFSFGCYVGEVIVRHLGGAWSMPDQGFLSRLGFGRSNMMVVQMPNGVVWNPIGKAFKRLEHGEGDSVSYLYDVAVSQAC